ncbi:SRPBCC domain-containing protein [Myxococcus sp. AB025B]|uniref:SRPBCC family protein n=1 Tax=Myxococcus sp. AB025B TaxID=2562794 RepID=UPI001143D9D7|nr:SRPBCC domain-containing protein [Myxococcus sp. AB025B]
MNPSKTVQVQLTRFFPASAERVFDAWLSPETLGRWMWGPGVRDEEVVHLRVDARVGGGFSFLVRRQGQDIDHIGTYLEMARPQRLVFTWAIREETMSEENISRVTLDFRPRDSGCELTLTHVMSDTWAEYADRTQAGWATMLTTLARELTVEAPRHG